MPVSKDFMGFTYAASAARVTPVASTSHDQRVNFATEYKRCSWASTRSPSCRIAVMASALIDDVSGVTFQPATFLNFDGLLLLSDCSSHGSLLTIASLPDAC